MKNKIIWIGGIIGFILGISDILLWSKSIIFFWFVDFLNMKSNYRLNWDDTIWILPLFALIWTLIGMFVGWGVSNIKKKK